MKKILLFFIVALFTACSALRPVTYSVKPTLFNYKYVYIMQTGSVTGSSNIYALDNGTIIGGTTNTTNPTDIMSGYLMQRGYTVIPQLNEKKLSETLIVSYGETGQRSMGFLWLFDATSIIVQFRDAQTNELIASAEAEDYGSTAADNVRYAIRRALDTIFSSATR